MGHEAGENNGITTEYRETDTERILIFEKNTVTVSIAQNRAGYAMLKVRTGVSGDEHERYYGLDMAIDHAAELLGVTPTRLTIPEEATDMGM